MRKIATALCVTMLGLLAVSTPGGAQTADPLGLISVGAVLPYVGSGQPNGEMAILEVSAPVGPVTDLHGIFFDSNGTRVGPSLGIPIVGKDVVAIRLDNLGFGVPTSGLFALASVDATGFNMIPLSNPVHARVVWTNPARDFVRTLEPIAIQNAEAVDPSQVWNPLRTAATFIAPLQTRKSQSELVLICPNQALITAAFPVSRFPALLPQPVASGPTPLRIRVYDLNAAFLTEIATTCDGLSRISLKSLDPVYSDAVNAPQGTYNEILGNSDTSGPFSFTGYLATSVNKFPDSFGRLHGASVSSIQGTPAPGAR